MKSNKTYYIHGERGKKFVKKVVDYINSQDILLTILEIDKLNESTIESDAHLVVTGSLHSIKEVLDYAYRHQLSMGIIPLPEQKELINTFALPKRFKASVQLALKSCDSHIDLLYCDDFLVLQEVVIGEVPPLDSFASSMEKETLVERFKAFFSMTKRVKHLKHTLFNVTTAKETKLKFSAIGAVGVEYNNRTFASKLITKYLKYNDGRLSLAILSPSSILQYMGYIFQTHILKQTPQRLPASVGYIHSKTLHIESNKPLPVTIDSDRCVQTPIVLDTKEDAVRLSVGDEFWRKSSPEKIIKESIRVDHLPHDCETSTYLGKSIPLFSHASTEQFTALFSNLREESSLSTAFMILLILSTMIASFGLYINSASVIIGAMLLAPLMQPIVGVSMGLLRQDIALFMSGVKSVGIGILAVILSAVVISWLLPLEYPTSEMNGRLSPTILDMFVAIVSGVAAAYAKSNEKIVGSLAGVAIAVALVPPLAVSGIGLGWCEWGMFSSAFLLFITNLVGIVMAASLTFMVLGFSPISVAKKGIFYATILVGIVSVPLSASFGQMKQNMDIQKKLNSFETLVKGKYIRLNRVELQKYAGRLELRCEVISSGTLDENEKYLLRRRISDEVGNNVRILVSFLYEL